MTALRTNLFLVALSLSLLGLVMIYSATHLDFGPHYLFLRAGHTVLGVLAFLAVSRVRYTALRKLSPFIYLGVLVSLVLVLIPGIGTKIGGSRRWFDLGVISLQPAEFAKVAAVIVLSCAIARYRPGASLPVGPLLGVGLLFVMVLLEPDFGTSVVLLAGVAGVLWASEVRTRDLVLSSGVVLAGILGAMWLEPYRRQRFLDFPGSLVGIAGGWLSDRTILDSHRKRRRLRNRGRRRGTERCNTRGSNGHDLRLDRGRTRADRDDSRDPGVQLYRVRQFPDRPPGSVCHGPVHGRRARHDAGGAGHIQHGGDDERTAPGRNDAAVRKPRGFQPDSQLYSRWCLIPNFGG